MIIFTVTAPKIVALILITIVIMIDLILLIKSYKEDSNNLYNKEINMSFIRDMKKISRENRHDFMNTLQIIYGYLQLRKYDNAIFQIKKVTDTMMNISKIYNLSVLSISLFLERKILKAANVGIKINFEVNNYVEDEFRKIKNEKEILENLEDISDYLIDFHDENDECSIYIIVLEHEDSISFNISGNFEENIKNDLKNKYSEIMLKDEGIIITYKYDEVEVLKLQDTIYNEIYSSNI
ncbi:putative signal transduction histidine kinase [Gottschalkia purinilytica]|uniref:Putative signal transduction histidine kinase n=1 Tax=Gottschalkia purinilytica TaxID=1503 RepID=A0A0L0WD91_GOTPU|nr:Spo0B domain-containing protein [Gottschalkia purinilytica]KNF09438.1 putative signal transduction histidine kinase [Gottschalkia purinilytica]